MYIIIELKPVSYSFILRIKGTSKNALRKVQFFELIQVFKLIAIMASFL